jgi:small subunit ribosomal protein S6
MTAHRTYELVYIVQPDASEQELGDLHTQVEGIIQRFSGVIDRTETWGRKRLAYEIGRYRDGVYVLEVFRGPADTVKELDRRLKVIDSVIRHLVIRVDEDMEIAERRKAERQAERARRRAARGLPPEIEPEAPRAEAPASSEETDDLGQPEAQR